MPDTRTSKRFPVHLPLKILGNQDIPDGSTENISSAGIYIWLEGGLEVGSSIEFEVTIPGESIAAESDVHLHCFGRVLRSDPAADSGRTGVACVIEQYELLRSGAVGGK